MPWTKQNIAGPIPSGLAGILQSLSSVISALIPLLATAHTAVEAAQLFFTPTSNPYASLVTALLAEVQNFNNDLFGTGIYFLEVNGQTTAGIAKYDQAGIPLLTPGNAILTAINSFDDTCDTNRPQFSVQAEVCATGVLATAPSVGEFIGLIQALLAIFSLPAWQSLLTTLLRIHTQVTCPASPPLWHSYRLNSIPQLKSIQDTINNLIAALLGYATVADNILAQLAAVIAGKQAQLQQLENQLNQIISGLTHTTGLYVFNLPPTIGGSKAIQTALLDCPLQNSTNQYTIMTLMVGGGPAFLPANLLRQMIL